MNLGESGIETENTIEGISDDPLLAANTPRTSTTSVSRKRKTTPDVFEQEVIKILKSNVEEHAKVVDPVEMFLLSQVSQINMLSSADKLDFQVKFMQLLQSYTVTTHSPSVTRPSTPLSNVIETTAIRPTYPLTSNPGPSTSQPPSVGSNLGSDDDSILSFLTL